MWTFCRILTWFDLCGHLAKFWLDLTYLDLSWPILTYLDLAWLIFTYLDLICTKLELSWPKLTYLDHQESFAAYAGSCLFIRYTVMKQDHLSNLVCLNWILRKSTQLVQRGAISYLSTRTKILTFYSFLLLWNYGTIYQNIWKSKMLNPSKFP